MDLHIATPTQSLALFGKPIISIIFSTLTKPFVSAYPTPDSSSGQNSIIVLQQAIMCVDLSRCLSSRALVGEIE